jgi:multisubunit Na+/H+ antiporter MnhC subunit
LAFGQETGDYPALVASLMKGEAPYSWLPLVSTLILTAVFIAAGILRFDREEF